MQQQLGPLLQNANVTMTNADTNLVMLADDLGRTLDNLANITSNLNQQVQTNSNMLKQISDIVVHSDEFVQGFEAPLAVPLGLQDARHQRAGRRFR